MLACISECICDSVFTLNFAISLKVFIHLGILLYFKTVRAGLRTAGSEVVAVLEGERVTLVCGTGLTGNPIPTVTWTDNNNRSEYNLRL